MFSSKKLSTRLGNKFLTVGVNLFSVIIRLKKRSFLRAISDSIEFRPDSFRISFMGENFGT